MFGMQIGRIGQTRFATWDQIVATMYQNGQVGGNLSFTDFSKIWQDSAGTTPYTAVEQYVGKIVDKSPNALAFTQTTNTSRPVLSAKVNGFTESEFRNGVTDAPSRGGLVTASTLPGYLGAIAFGAGVDSYAYKQPPSSFLGLSVILSVIVQMTDLGVPVVNSASGAADFCLVVNGAFATNSTVVSLGGGFYRVSSAFVHTAGYPGVVKYSTNSARTFKVTAYDLRPASRSSLPYQRVNTSTDYDTVGFPYYIKFDGIDDHFIGAAGGGGTAGIYFCGAIQFNIVGAVQTIFSDAGTNSGYKLQLTAANQLQISAGNGTAFTTINTTATFAAGDVSLVELWDDGTNLGVRLGEGTPVTVARPVVTAGTAQITLGKDNNAASNYAGISMFEPVWRYGAMPNATQREAIRAICRSKAGIA